MSSRGNGHWQMLPQGAQVFFRPPATGAGATAWLQASGSDRMRMQLAVPLTTPSCTAALRFT